VIRTQFVKLFAIAAFFGLPSALPAEPPVKIIPYSEARQYYGIRFYNYGYPYQVSTGHRYDPYWSYNASYFPESYHGDGSYYGIGYSGGTASGYWYW
jgi:hypothetical protein